MTIRIGANNFVRRTSGWLLVGSFLLVGLAMTLLHAPAALAQPRDPCTSAFIPIPDCELQVQAPVQYKAWHSSNMNYYCTGTHPYFYGMNQSYILSYTFDNSCFTVTENVFGDEINKLEVLITNWCVVSEDVVVTLACSAQAPPGSAFCDTEGDPMSDPKCPVGPSKNYCSGGPVPACFQIFKETCTNNVSYQCQAIFGIVSCQQCVPNGNARAKASKIKSIPSLGPSVR